MRTYLYYNSTVPLRSEAKQAMIDAMDYIGNPSSVHLEGRAAKNLIEIARAKIAEAVGAVGADIIFTSVHRRGAVPKGAREKSRHGRRRSVWDQVCSARSN